MSLHIPGFRAIFSKQIARERGMCIGTEREWQPIAEPTPLILSNAQHEVRFATALCSERRPWPGFRFSILDGPRRSCGLSVHGHVAVNLVGFQAFAADHQVLTP